MNTRLISQLKKHILLLTLLTLTFSLSIIYFAENLKLTSKVTDSTLTFSFNVKAPVATPGPSGGPGGGGGGGGGGGCTNDAQCAFGLVCNRQFGICVQKPVEEFLIEPELIKLSVRQGDTKKATIVLKNQANTYLDILLRINGIDTDLLTFPTGLPEYSIILLKGQTTVIPLTATIPINLPVSILSGTLTATSARTTRALPIFIDIKPVAALLDSTTFILPEYKQTTPGSPLYATISIKNLGIPGRVDIAAVYGIRDALGNDYELKREFLAVETQAEIVRAFIIPYNLAPGTYVLYTKISYGDNLQDISSDTFQVSASESSFLEQSILLFLFLLAFTQMLLLLYTLFNLYIIHPAVHTPSKNLKRRPPQKESGRPRDERTQEQLRVLEESYRAGVISEAAYRQDKERLVKR